MPMGQQRARVAQKASGVPGCTGRSVASRTGEGIPPLCSALVRLRLECGVRCWAPQVRRDRELLERGQRGLRR